jgi:uncharacterized protein (DUF1800 family)
MACSGLIPAMDTHDARPRSGRHRAAVPKATALEAGTPTVTTHEATTLASSPATTVRSRRGLRAAEKAARAAAAAPDRPANALRRRTALSLAGTGAALVGVAVASHKAPDPTALAQSTRDIPAPTGARPKARSVEYQVPAAGRAPAVSTSTVTPNQPPTILTLDQALHLARRATWGPAPAVVRDIRRMGARAWLERQLRPSSIPDRAMAAYLRPFDTLGATPATLRAMDDARSKQDYWYAHDQLESAAIARATWSERQLFEVMVDFWHSRLHVAAHLDKTRDTLNSYDATVIRRHAMGRFSDMLSAMITHPAMIVYLDNQNNTKNGGNQNLGRELLELHTLGVDAGYRQADIEGAALLLTGLSVDPRTLAFVYRPEQHHVGTVRAFGRTYANASARSGQAAVKALITDLAMHPKTAHYLALDLARRFVSDTPPKRLVDGLAAVYLKSRTAMVPVLRALFSSPEFAASVGQKYRRPMEHAVASMRALGLRMGDRHQYVQAVADLRYWLDSLGQAPLGCPTPDGYKDFLRPWLSSDGILGRWNLDMSLAGQWRKGLSAPDVAAMLAGATTYEAAVDRLYARLTFQRPTATERRALLSFLEQASGSRLDPQARDHDYRLRVQLVTLILGGPHHQLR